MPFDIKLDKALITDILENSNSEQELLDNMLTEEDRGRFRKVFDMIRKLFSLRMIDLFKLAYSGGSVNESYVVINDLFVEDITTIMTKSVEANTIDQGNYLKVVQISVKTNQVSFTGYVLAPLNSDDNDIASHLELKILAWRQGEKMPFRWFRNLKDAQREMEVKERKMVKRPEAKPALKSLKHESPTSYSDMLNKPAPAKQDDEGIEFLDEPDPNVPKDQPEEKPADAEKIAVEVARRVAPRTAQQIGKMNREQLRQAAEVGQEVIRRGGKSRWELAKTVFLGYLSLAALVHGAPGLAALIIGYLAVTGVQYLNRTGGQQQQRPRRGLERARQILRARQQQQ